MFENKEINLNEIIKNLEKYLAHTKIKEELTENETLSNHINLAKEYFFKMIKENYLENYFNTFIENSKLNFNEEEKKLIEESILGTILFHDAGKINFKFQKNKLNNEEAIKNDFGALGSDHSIISSAIYINTYLDKFLKIKYSKNNTIFLVRLIFLNSFIISKHHSNLGKFENYLESFLKSEGNGYEAYSRIFDFSSELKLNSKIKDIKGIVNNIKKSLIRDNSFEENFNFYVYSKMMFSLLFASDFYSTNEFMNDFKQEEVRGEEFFKNIIKEFNNTDVNNSIKSYREKRKEIFDNINDLRSELFIDTERALLKNIDKNIFYLEAPTGSGKSNTAFNLTFKLIEKDKGLKRIIYTYPFNTLVEQNISNLEKTLSPNVMEYIAIVNSSFPIKVEDSYINKSENNLENEEVKEIKYYEKALLNYQFLNYPIILNTHVSLFNILFSDKKEHNFPFYKLSNSVVVLDEIQSYKISLWPEIIESLNYISKAINMKVIIMSATLPNLNKLLDKNLEYISLVEDRRKYFESQFFKNRVKVNYELIDLKLDKEEYLKVLEKHIKENMKSNKKIIVEFINKKLAISFYNSLKESYKRSYEIELLTGNDNISERKRTLDKFSNNKKGIVLISTQIIEAGVDIDGDIGYKDISNLDSEEQFLGRINRSCKRDGKVYFFNLYNSKNIYKNDQRQTEELTLKNKVSREILENKNFDEYYKRILLNLKINKNSMENLGYKSFQESLKKLDFIEVKEHMKLIEEIEKIRIFINLEVEIEGKKFKGIEVWEEYKRLILDKDMSYSERAIKIKNHNVIMNNFIYEDYSKRIPNYSDLIGDLYFIEEVEQYIENNKFNLDKLFGTEGDFI